MYVGAYRNTNDAVENILRLYGNEKIANKTINEISSFLNIETTDQNLLEKADQLPHPF